MFGENILLGPCIFRPNNLAYSTGPESPILTKAESVRPAYAPPTGGLDAKGGVPETSTRRVYGILNYEMSLSHFFRGNPLAGSLTAAMCRLSNVS